MALKRTTADDQLELFAPNSHEHPDSIRNDGRKTLARTLPEAALRDQGKIPDELLQQMLQEAEEKTKDEMATLRLELMKQGKTAEQAQRQAWELVREKYILLPPEA